MTSAVHTALDGTPGVGGAPVKIEVSYRQSLGRYLRLVAGRFPGPVPPAPRRAAPPKGNVFPVNGVGPQPYFSPLMDVVVTAPTAARFGLHPGSRIVIAGPQQAFNGSGPITLEVTGIVAPRDASATFWTADEAILTPDFVMTTPLSGYWVSGVLVGPSELAAVQQDFGPEGLAAQWLFPLSVGSPGGDQVGPLDDALTRLGARTPPLTGDIAPMAADFTVTPNLVPALEAFLSTEQAVDTLLWLLYWSLAVACLVVFLLTARMIALHRSAELAVRRARGASLRQITATAALGTALTGVPGAIVGVVLATLVVPGPAPGGGWWGPTGVLVVAVCAPAIVRGVAAAAAAAPARATERPARDRLGSAGRRGHRDRRLGGGNRRIPPAGHPTGQRREPVHERRSRTDRRPRGDRMLWIYPLVLRVALRGAARRAGAPAFLGLARAARSRLTPALPAFALVLALSVAAFAGMVTTAVSSGDVRASWQAAGADATVSASILQTPGAVIDPAALRAAETVPGVTHAAAVWVDTWTTSFGQQVTGIVVDPAAYAALVATTQTFPRMPADCSRRDRRAPQCRWWRPLRPRPS